ncbi:MAG: cbb3-type cytochrome c oxidase subunit II [Candidatus Tectomicrobia bacterium]|nr:cbb3-type cytochrome c oxidase subunit II [Candidatus Tectomicrobia bacterium]
MERFNNILFIAGFGFFLFAFVVVGAIPWAQTYGRTPTPQAKPYTDLELRGRQLYIREVCWHCHTQFVRPVPGEPERYGPVSVAGEYVYDRPHLLGTRRVGPDLAREGGLRTDDWHIAHLRNPRALVPESIMPSFPWLGEEELKALTAYLQKLGTNIGPWRKQQPQEPGIGAEVAAATPDLLAQGKMLYERNCFGCHGMKGAGDGPAAVALNPKPRDFTIGEYKYGGGPQEVAKTIAQGVPGTAMPPWGQQLSTKEIYALTHYVRSFKK